MPIKGHRYPRDLRLHCRKSAEQIVSGVCEHIVHGNLGTGKYHRLSKSPEHKAQHRGRIGHGIGAMGDDKPVIAAQILIDTAGHDLPFLRLNVGGIQIHDLLDLHLKSSPEVSKAGKKLLPGHLRLQSIGAGPGGNGAAGAQK